MSKTPLPVIVNGGGGAASRLGEKLGDTVEAAFAAVGLTIALELPKGEAIGVAITTAAGAPIVAIGGGDGTLGHAAGDLAKAGSTLAVLPLGTRNHLARQLGIADLKQACQVIAGDRRGRIDLAQAGDRVFVNNASIGIYTGLVRERDRLPGPKWLGTIPATFHVLKHMRTQHMRLTIDGKSRSIKTPLLFIGNNRYSLKTGSLGQRKSLSDGVLSLFAVSARTPMALIGFALRTLVGRSDPERDYEELCEAKQVIVEGHGCIDVAFDGEVEECRLPLTFKILPGALEVLVPAGKSVTARAASSSPASS